MVLKTFSFDVCKFKKKNNKLTKKRIIFAKIN